MSLGRHCNGAHADIVPVATYSKGILSRTYDQGCAACPWFVVHDHSLLFKLSTNCLYIVHGDFGPQNMLIAPDSRTVAALVDWGWVRVGQPAADLAWAEWMVLSHHPHAVREREALFRGYGAKPTWELRHDRAMLSPVVDNGGIG